MRHIRRHHRYHRQRLSYVSILGIARTFRQKSYPSALEKDDMADCTKVNIFKIYYLTIFFPLGRT